MRVSTFWKRVFYFLLSFTFVVLTGLQNLAFAPSVSAMTYCESMLGKELSCLEIPNFETSLGKPIAELVDGDAIFIPFQTSFGMVASMKLTNLDEIKEFRSNPHYDRVPFDSEEVIFRTNAKQSTFSFPNNKASSRLVSAGGDVYFRLTLYPLNSDGSVGNNNVVSIFSYTRLFKSIAGQVVKKDLFDQILSNPIGKFVVDLTPSLDAPNCLGINLKLDGTETATPQWLSCTAIIPVGKVFKYAGKAFKVGEVVFKDGKKIQRLIEVIDDIAKVGTKLERVEQVANIAVKTEKAATLAWLKKGASEMVVYLGKNTETNAVEYVGITNNFAARKAQHIANGRSFLPEQISKLPLLTRNEARSLEQYLIDYLHAKELIDAVGSASVQNLRNEVNNGRSIFEGSQEFARLMIANFGIQLP